MNEIFGGLKEIFGGLCRRFWGGFEGGNFGVSPFQQVFFFFWGGGGSWVLAAGDVVGVGFWWLGCSSFLGGFVG